VTKIYIASGLKNALTVTLVQDWLRVFHHTEVTFDWAKEHLKMAGQATTPQYKLNLVNKMYRAVLEAEGFLLMLPAKRGAHVEFGLAYGLGKPITLFNADPAEDISFYMLPGVDLYRNRYNAACHLLEKIEQRKVLRDDVKLRLCFDVDGLIAQEEGNKPYEGREPHAYSVAQIRLLKAAGHTIIFQTARGMSQHGGVLETKTRRAYMAVLMDWLTQHKVPYDEVYTGKASADMYMDDRGCRVRGSEGSIDWESNFWPALAKLQEAKR
jgi:capsule biosynthesis phosphatase